MSDSVVCTICKRPYPASGMPYRCPHCLGLYDFAGPLVYPPSSENEALRLGEGDTPLEWRTLSGRQVAFKLEFLNPTGAVTDRAAAALAAFAQARLSPNTSTHAPASTQPPGEALPVTVVDDSSGRMGVSLARCTQAVGLRAHIYLPDAAPSAWRAKIEAVGGQTTRVMGPRSNAHRAVLRAVDAGAHYASHVYLPHGIAGYAAIAYELFQQLGQAPGAVLLPLGQGVLFLGVQRGFDSLQRAGKIEQAPRLVGVQPLACAPLWALYTYGAAGLSLAAEGPTSARGAQVIHPLRGDAVMQGLADERGLLAAVDEDRILEGQRTLAELGFAVEPTAALVWDGLAQTLDELPDPVVALLTGAAIP